jgi:flagellar hook-associated protein 3 FlgL
MRVSDKVLYNTATNDLQQNLEKLLGLQEKVSSGKRINRPSDDPAGAAKVVDYNTALSRVEQYQRNINNASSFLSATESAISNTQNVIVRAKEISTSALNSTNTADERHIMAQEVDQLYQQVLQEANTQSNGRYLFSGYNTGTAAYDSNGVYTGTASPDGNIAVEINSGTTVTMNMPGYRVFGTSTTGTDILGTLSNLKSSLENNNLNGISVAAGNLDSAMNQLNNVRSEVGARMNRLETTKGFLSKLSVDLTGYKSEVEDADITRVITDLAMQQNIIEASKASVSNVLNQSLLNFLK